MAGLLPYRVSSEGMMSNAAMEMIGAAARKVQSDLSSREPPLLAVHIDAPMLSSSWLQAAWRGAPAPTYAPTVKLDDGLGRERST
jgi:hypothetical protein